MTAQQHLDAGDLAAAIAQVSEDLRKSPTDHSKRTFLFELLCCAGDLDRAGRHLDVIAGESAERAAAVMPYRILLEAEKQRRKVFAESLIPGLPQKIPDCVPLHLEAIRQVREKHYAEARALLEQAAATRTPQAGTIDGEPFEDLSDADDLMGPFLEAIVNGNYAWLPWDSVELVVISRPRHLRELVWVPARVDLNIGPLGDVFLPALYVDSYLHADPRVKLGRLTDWRQDVPEIALAAGQKLLTAGERDWPLLEVRSIAFAAREETDGVSGTAG